MSLGKPAAMLTALALVGCAPSSDMTQLQSNESSLREMVANDRSQIEGLQEQLARQNDKIAELEHGGSGNDLAALQARISKLESGGATPAAAPSPGTEPGAEAPGGEASPGENPAEEGNAAPSPAAAPTASTGQTGSAPTWQAAAAAELAGTQTDAGAKLYRAGLGDMQAGKYQSALGKFQDLQRRYPKSPLSEPAEYFSGNALYELGQHEKSILQFNDLTMRFPEGRYASAALLREAQAFIKISDQIDARLTLNKLLNDHPDAPEAVTARSLMQSLSS
jgi:tol-pal system protein YbgF